MCKAKILFVLLFINSILYSQEELKLYKNIYTTSDALKKSGHILDLNKEIFIKAKELDQQHPSKYFETAANYLNKSKFNEASFLYYTGLMRFKYYNSSNPDYQESNDGALLGSLKYAIGEPINMYLKTDINNYISILEKAVEYCKNNDFNFYPKSKSPENYNNQLTSCLKLKTDLENNKTKYSDLWNEETKKIKISLKIK
ncbi:MAG: hypothetical protein RSH24_06030 [Flavobacterium sp.]